MNDFWLNVLGGFLALAGFGAALYIGYEVWFMLAPVFRKPERPAARRGSNAAYERSQFDTAPLNPDSLDSLPETYGKTQTVRRMIQYFEQESDQSNDQ